MRYAIARKKMVERQIRGRGITDQKVLKAMLEVPRHLFVEPALESQAYSDSPLPIGYRQTISQPYMVGYMTAALELQGDEKVLEVGTGSGYQAAILARIARKVYTVERIPELARRARRLFDQLGLNNINLKVCDGSLGWASEAPFDAIVVTAASPDIPEEYLQQLADGGRLVIPVGGQEGQLLKRVTRRGDHFETENLLGCRFVPLIGERGWADDEN
ncbi:protein-L-isoaspartate(D-aspartate) O-methyltransferase [Geothermobacter ehrlichii]|uniref:Protein-L-isoaspartate O-methyltransferase n=1 Tax=Geothermobacter ehrlichii TaxID=213224 RepID=A0A5D3WP00_9BACT|nr:protein-L-isoaspartate(D-aspartate) O-methyltransferase [Geothermobacter ehrlichii]TYP00278.1 protein-L-isoaspartate(D-aspartate) O-methyltransferase [Geothermobacter ehrlichii]